MLRWILHHAAPVSIVAAFCALSLVGCGTESGQAPTTGHVLDAIRKSGELVVLTRNAPTIYYVGRDHVEGPEHDMTAALAAYLGVKVKYKIFDNINDILVALQAGKGQLAAAGLTETKSRKQRFLAGPSYQRVRQQVVCRRGGKQPRHVSELVGLKLAVVARSSYIDELVKLKQRFPKLGWKVVNDADTEEMLERVWRRQIDCTVADSNIVKINRRYHPELTVAFDLTPAQPLVWYFPKGAHGLQAATKRWFVKYQRNGDLANMLERYYGFVRVFDYVDIRHYMRRIRNRLPDFRDLFETAGKRFHIRWTLLAAQAYQESRWNPLATSPSGVRGIMMLTQATAAQLGVDSRLQPKQSILGGAKYLNQLRKRLPDSVAEPDRTWIALAAYNVGMAHVRDAQQLAKRLGLDADSWHDLKTVLPLLSKEHYYKALPNGYARGNEAVRYVARVRNFEDILIRTLKLARR